MKPGEELGDGVCRISVVIGIVPNTWDKIHFISVFHLLYRRFLFLRLLYRFMHIQTHAIICSYSNFYG